ncbi:hypothetical protein SprV_0301169800 [Sparganum proliferum]
MEEVLRSDQSCLRSASQSNRSSSPRRRHYPTHREDANSAAMSRTPQRHPQTPSAISDADIARLTQLEINADLDLPPSLHETIRAMQWIGRCPC